MQNGLIVSFLCLFLLLPGCARHTSKGAFLRENVELGYIRRIAVLPLENHTNDEFVAPRLRNVINTQILAMGLFDAVDKGLVDAAFREEALKEGDPIDLISLKRLGRRLGVQALLVGSVDQSRENRKGSIAYDELSLTLRLLDAREALVLWQHNDYKSGYSAWGRFFGLSAPDSFEVAFSLINEMLSTIPATGKDNNMMDLGVGAQGEPVSE